MIRTQRTDVTVNAPRRGQSRAQPTGAAPKNRVPALLLLGITALAPILSGCRIVGARTASSVAALGQPAPDFELRTIPSDEPVRLSRLRDKPVVINFYCGCTLCYNVAHAWHRVKEKVGDVHLLAIMHNHETFNPVNVREFREATKWEAPVLADLRSRVALKYRSTDCPMTWVIDRKGIVRYHNEHRTDPPDEIVGGALAALKEL
jgi:peroxiredoxin